MGLQLPTESASLQTAVLERGGKNNNPDLVVYSFSCTFSDSWPQLWDVNGGEISPRDGRTSSSRRRRVPDFTPSREESRLVEQQWDLRPVIGTGYGGSFVTGPKIPRVQKWLPSPWSSTRRLWYKNHPSPTNTRTALSSLSTHRNRRAKFNQTIFSEPLTSCTGMYCHFFLTHGTGPTCWSSNTRTLSRIKLTFLQGTRLLSFTSIELQLKFSRCHTHT
jgi:hypothetical protein